MDRIREGKKEKARWREIYEMSKINSGKKYNVLTCHAFHNGLEIWFTVLRILSGGTIEYALYVTEAQTTRTDVSGHATIRIVVVFDVDRLGLVFFAVVRTRTVLERWWFQITGQHYILIGNRFVFLSRPL